MNRSSRAAIARSKSIDHQIEEERERREKEVPILILGGSGAGKSTFIKQVHLHYGNGFPISERQAFVPYIIDNITDALNNLVTQMHLLRIEFENTINKDASLEFCKRYPRILAHTLLPTSASPDDSPEEVFPQTTEITTGGATCPGLIVNLTGMQKSLTNSEFTRTRPSLLEIQEVWKDSGVQKCLKEKDRFLAENKLKPAEYYFLMDIDRVLKKDYVPTVDDIMHIRRPTLGVQEHTFTINSLNYKVVDVAGQKSQRKKWIHFFDGVAAVMFFTSLSGFDENLEEETSLNSLQDSLQTFNEVTHNQFLEGMDFILFLNKWDLFKEKLAVKSIHKCFPDYSGSSNADDSVAFIKGKFESCKSMKQSISTHVTCAINIELMKKVVDQVLQIIIEINFRRLGPL